MKGARLISTTLSLSLLLATGCETVSRTTGTSEPLLDPNEVVASVNGTTYRRKDMTKAVDALLKAQNIPSQYLGDARRYFERRTVYTFVVKTLMLNEVRRERVKITEKERKIQLAKMEESLREQNKTADQYFKESPLGEKAARAEFEDDLAIDKLLQKKVLCSIRVDAAEVQQTLDGLARANTEIAEKNKVLDEVNAGKRAKILDLKKQLDAGVDFAGLAKANSDCPSKKNGGNLGEFTRGQMTKTFENAAFSLEVGKVSDIVETPFGYHLIKVTAKKPAQNADGDQPAQPETVTASHILIKAEQAQPTQPIPTKEQAQSQLWQEKSRDAVQKYTDTLRHAAKVTTLFPDLFL